MIYTTGYYGHQPEALKALAAALDATVVDIRFMPASGFFAVPQLEGAHA